jgi:hypothetical protein
MRPVFILLFLASLFLGSCDIQKKERQLEKRETELNQKEQALLQKEKTLQLKEDELIEREQKINSSDSTSIVDSIYYDPDLIGTWSVSMNCIETSCPGSAVGDIKTEHWEIQYQSNHLIARVIDNKKLVRVYSGTSTSSSIELKLQQSDLPSDEPANMVVRLQQTGKGRLEGRREILRISDNCKVVYAVDMTKQ